MGIRDEKAQATKNKIVEAARILIQEKGIENVSIDDITKKALVAKGSFYVYFKKKEDIINEIGCMEFRYINEEINKMNDLKISEKLKYYFRRYKEGLLLIGKEISKCWLQNNLNCRCKLEYDFAAIGDMVRRAKANHELKDDIDVDTLTYRIIVNLYGLMLIWIMSDGKIELDDEKLNISIDDILNPYIVR